MSTRFAVLFLLVALSCISLIGAKICPADEEFKSCGTACENRCNVPPADLCPAVCVTGCFCKKGYLRNNMNKCVLAEDC